MTRRAPALLVASAVLLVSPSCGHPSRPDRAAVTRYQQAIKPQVEEWGRIEILGMRPAIDDLQHGGDVPPEAIATEADAWTSGLRQIRDRMHAVKAPAPLRPAAQLFDRALVKYLAAAQQFGQAARAAAADRQALIVAGVDDVHDGTRLYNRAALILQRVRRQAGLPKTPDFPDHPAA